MGKKNKEVSIKSVVKKDFIEIQDGEMYLKLPKDRSYRQVIDILSTFHLNPEPVQEIVSELKKEEEVSVTAEPQIDEFMTRCPKCNSKLKSKVKKRGNELIRIVKCKKNKRFGKKCDFMHEFSIKV